MRGNECLLHLYRLFCAGLDAASKKKTKKVIPLLWIERERDREGVCIYHSGSRDSSQIMRKDLREDGFVMLQK